MNFRKSFESRLILLIFLLALPALACSTLTGDNDEGEPAAETASSDQAPAADSDDQPAALDADGSGESDAAGDQDRDQDSGDADEASGGPEKTGGDPRESIISALRSGLEVDAMRLHIVTEDMGSGLVSDVILAFVRPDRYQLKSDDIEFVVVDDTTYLRGPDGNWTTLPGAEMTSTVEATLDAFAGAAVIESRQDSLSQSDVNFEGKETINGVDTLVYSFGEGLPGVGISGLIKMWIGEDDGLLYRQEVESKIGDQESRILMEFEYGAAVTIEPPE
jgi:hypothetical protein